jgi:beta-xylosidase
MRNTIKVIVVVFMCMSAKAQPTTAPTTAPTNLPDDLLLFANFHGHSEDGLHFAWSADGLNWWPVKDDASFLKPQVGSQKLMRDPSVFLGPDGIFRLVWTTGWQGRDIGYASSKDLIHWSEQKAIPVMEDEPTARNCWAPEMTYDESKQQYVVFWATTIPGKFPETEATGDKGSNHRIYCTKTKDFQTFSKAELFFEPGFEVIDATMLHANGKHYLFFKDETAHPQVKKHIQIAASDTVEGPFKVISDPITPDWCEGPTVVKFGDSYLCYYDMYRQSRIGAVRSKDLKNWDDISDKLSISRLTKHGTVIQVKKQILEAMMQ